MKLFIQTLLIGLVVGVTNTAIAKPSEAALELVKQQVEQVQWHGFSDDNRWGFTIETRLLNGSRPEQQRIQRFNPSLEIEQQWQLVQHDGLVPTARMQEEYKAIQEGIRAEAQNEYTAGVKVIQLDSLQFKREQQNTLIFSFQPYLPMFDEDDVEVLEGELFFNKQTQQIEGLEIVATDSFSPAMTVTVESFDMKIKLQKLGEFFHVHSISSNKTGSIFLLADFKEISRKIFSDFIENKNP